MPSEDAPSPSSPRRAPRWRRWIFIAVLALAAWGAYLVLVPARATATLPDGMTMTVHGYSHGELQPAAPGASPWARPVYKHTTPIGEPFLQRKWQGLRASLPGWLASRLPAWDTHQDDYDHGSYFYETELWLHCTGDLGQRQWDIFVADMNGWETRVPFYIWCDDGRHEREEVQRSGWVRLGSPYPRYSKSLRLRFRPSIRRTTGFHGEQEPDSFTEMVFRNPFSLGTPTTKGSPLPITKPFRDGTITLDSVTRDPVVGGRTYGTLLARFHLLRDGKPREKYDLRDFYTVDSSGQKFYDDTGGGTFGESGYKVFSNVAPWSDDPCWTIHLALCRGDFSKEVDEKDIFRFEKLPVPGDSPVEINRFLTRDGITLTLGTLTAIKHGEAQFTIAGWTRQDPRRRLILIHDVRDDQGRTKVRVNGFDNELLVSGPDGRPTDDPIFRLRLPTDAKSWDLAVIPETVTEVDFTFQAPQFGGVQDK